MTNNKISPEKIQEVLKKNKINESLNIIELTQGYNRRTYDIDNKYILKICINPEKEVGTKNEISFFHSNVGKYYPELIASDETKEIIPYLYTIEEKIMGQNLFEIWPSLSYSEKIKLLDEMVEIFRQLHKPIEYDYNIVQKLLDNFNINLEKCREQLIFSIDEIEDLNELKLCFDSYFKNVKMGYIHGDIHFNNILLSKSGLKLIDFENYGIGPIDKEFDSINRMIRKPDSYISDEKLKQYQNPADYAIILEYFKIVYPEICSENNFDDRLLIYDCLNSMKWIYYYPNYQLYHDVLFNDSKKLKFKKF